MARELGVGQVPVVRTTYPHLLSEDTVVWSRWLTLHPGRATLVWYDVHVGEPMSVPADVSPRMRQVALGVSRKRIDVIALVEGGLWVCEIKPYANFVALGQALVYARLVRSEVDPPEMIAPVVICSAVDPDLVADFGKHGVRLEVVGYGEDGR